MKNIIHVDIQDESGNNTCFEREGGFLLALRVLLMLWRSGAGSITINPEKEEYNE